MVSRRRSSSLEITNFLLDVCIFDTLCVVLYEDSLCRFPSRVSPGPRERGYFGYRFWTACGTANYLVNSGGGELRLKGITGKGDCSG